MYIGNENSKPIWNKFIIRKDIIETSQVVLNFCRTVYIALLSLIVKKWSLHISYNMKNIRVITKLPNSEQSYKGKVKTHKYINRQNQSTTGKLWNISLSFCSILYNIFNLYTCKKRNKKWVLRLCNFLIKRCS